MWLKVGSLCSAEASAVLAKRAKVFGERADLSAQLSVLTSCVLALAPHVVRMELSGWV